MSKTLLLADDSVTIQKVVGISFASEDIAITTVDNGDDAITRAREMRPDVILADVVMPGKSGYEVCEAVKADPDLRHIPVLLLTGTFEAFDEERAANAGAAGQVSKPFEAHTLVERVKDLLANAPSPQPAPTPTPTPTPTATPPAEPKPAPAGADNAFDFFDDPAPLETPAAAAPPPVPEPAHVELQLEPELELDGPDAAFTFGEDELQEPQTDVVEPATTAPPPLPPVAHTVAILPDDTDDTSPDAGSPETPDSLAETPAPLFGSALPPAPPTLPESPGSTPESSNESYEFEFEGMSEPAAPSTPAASAAPASPASAGPSLDSLAESTLLDPDGDSAYDVSSSELSDLVAPSRPHEMPASHPAAATQLLPTPFPGAAAAPGGEPSPQEPVPEILSSDPIDPRSVAPSASFVEEQLAGPPEALTEIESTPEAAPAARIPDDALAQIAPALKEQLHETLEKIAWEAFGQVTEKIVAESVQQLERIAWEVVPKLAETLIVEEIRKLKGE